MDFEDRGGKKTKIVWTSYMEKIAERVFAKKGTELLLYFCSDFAKRRSVSEVESACPFSEEGVVVNFCLRLPLANHDS